MLTGQIVNAIILGSIYLLFSLGLTLSWGILKVLNLAHGSIFMFGAFSAYLLTQNAGADIPLPLLVLFAAVVGGLLSLLLQVLVFRPILNRATDLHAAEMATLIASIGASLIPIAIALNLSPAEVVNLPLQSTQTTIHRWGPVVISDLQISIIVIAVAATVALWLWVSKSQGGRALRTIAVAPKTAELLGIPVARYSALTMCVSGVLAGAAGILLAANANAIEAHMGDGLLLKAFAVIILGGVGSIPGAAIGAFVLAIAETATVVYLSGGLRSAIAFALILIVLVLRPSGLFGEKAWKRA
ncbi:branched-chain amino acid ABC transporter permease [Agromyces aerolatus]|uniref:branched-chain amino acid ABC transporter permease n=1 Tax=Agromyces sp. LY-1074 TaxID=3074080 RepID=UPI002863A6CB|nr:MULTISPECIES: branched-chain amino acid ABC transporter permease [unclassified Agromyces]MDR5699762.1 branched-chain amino acid ABC transporter permease [Agromyces sp. LY-1074]MDR5706058.1 branched-chain amino acid ABC transporter permease [Agromyces sp. LY-1358]